MPKQPAVIYLLDWLPVWWSTREEFHSRISRRLAEQGVQTILVVARPPEARVVERFERAGAKVVAAPYEGRYLRYWRWLKPLFVEYDVRVAHVRFFDYFSLVPWICKLLGAPLTVFTESNSGEARPLGVLGPLKRLRTQLALRPAQKIIAISEFIRERLLFYGARERRIVVVHNGIDVEPFHRNPDARRRLEDELSIRPDEFVVVFMSALLPWKRPELALAVCAKLRERGVPLRLLMCGDGPLRAALEGLGGRLGLEDAVVWTGHHPNPQRLFQGADAFLHTAAGEAFGNVLAEAMACSVPVVSVRRGAVAEVVEHNVTGLLADPGPDETDALAEALAALQADPELLDRLGAAGAVRARERFSLELSIERTLAVYELNSGRSAV